MRSRKDHTRCLFLAATIMVVALLLTSDFSPEVVTDISKVDPAAERIEIICTVAGSSTTTKGFMLILEDSRGQQVKGFASADLAPMPELGALVKIDADVSWDEGPFLYVKGVVRLA